MPRSGRSSPPDRQVYLDLSFLQELQHRLNAPGDFAAAYVIALNSHHVQNQLGIMDKANEIRAGLGQEDSNALSVRIELQADCFAGWAIVLRPSAACSNPATSRRASTPRPRWATTDSAAREAISSRRASRHLSEQRVAWFTRGFENEDRRATLPSTPPRPDPPSRPGSRPERRRHRLRRTVILRLFEEVQDAEKICGRSPRLWPSRDRPSR